MACERCWPLSMLIQVCEKENTVDMGGGEGPSTTNEVGNMEGETTEHVNVESSSHELRQSGVAEEGEMIEGSRRSPVQDPRAPLV